MVIKFKTIGQLIQPKTVIWLYFLKIWLKKTSNQFMWIGVIFRNELFHMILFILIQILIVILNIFEICVSTDFFWIKPRIFGSWNTEFNSWFWAKSKNYAGWWLMVIYLVSWSKLILLIFEQILFDKIVDHFHFWMIILIFIISFEK